MRRTYLALSDEDRHYLITLSKKRTIQAQIVDRAKILLYKSDGMTFSDIAEKLAVSPSTVRLCISKYYEGGVENALFDTQRPGRPSEITDDAKAWMINIACQRPVELGYAQELWTLNSLHKHIRKHAEEAGYPRLSTVTNTDIIDELPLDYSILEEIDYEYPAHNAYFGYMTRGCPRNCAFCAVKTLEPQYKNYIGIKHQIKYVDEHFGAQKDLLLMDNNVFASNCFEQIIDEIKDCGFGKGATYIPPNEYDVAIKNLKVGYNLRAYTKKIIKLYDEIAEKLSEDEAGEFYLRREERGLLYAETATYDEICTFDETIRPLYDKLFHKSKRVRYIDFNQGLDARLATDKRMKKLSEINIRPLRIAFDHYEQSEVYISAVKKAAKYGIMELSNYLLYNFEDEPKELYYRMRINVDLCEELGVTIYSFPMKYHPINDPEYFKNRDYLGKHWNRKFIRAVQAVLNSTKGKIGKGIEFFEEAFGRDLDEFYKILWMPETFIIYRRKYDKKLRERLADRYKNHSSEDCDLANEWWTKFCSLPAEKLEIAKSIISLNKFKEGITVQDLRNDSFDIFRERAILSKRMDRKDVDATNEQLLDSLNLLENGQLKRAAILLFHHNPEKWIPGAYVKIGYFESDSELRYQDEIHGSLISQADRVVDLIFTKYLKADISYKGVTRVETYPFPKDAIREAVFNAIAHKFYGALIPIQISVYADRLYIANDCIFPGDWTLDDLMGKHRSRPYNPLIANTFFRAGFIEAWGRGIEKIKDSCKEAGNPIPEYTIKREDIMIMFKSLVSYTNQATNQATDQTNQDEDNSVPARILKVIETKPMLSQRKIADIIGEKYSTVKYYMESMKKSGIIKREGSSQKGKWIIL